MPARLNGRAPAYGRSLLVELVDTPGSEPGSSRFESSAGSAEAQALSPTSRGTYDRGAKECNQAREAMIAGPKKRLEV